MKALFFYFLLAYLLDNFALLFFERPKKLGRVLALMFFGIWIDIFITIRVALKG